MSEYLLGFTASVLSEGLYRSNQRQKKKEKLTYEEQRDAEDARLKSESQRVWDSYQFGEKGK